MNATAKSLFSGRSYGGSQRRFANPVRDEPIDRGAAALSPNHPAVTEGRTIFSSRVFDAADRARVLISGVNNAKIGRIITKGPWRGLPIYTFSLEERATCPRSCDNWDTCYGNALPMAVRFRYSPNVMTALESDLRALARQHAGGFAVRLHVLGDFPELSYVGAWAEWMFRIPHLRVWGYTAHPADSEIGAAVAKMTRMFPGRWAFRHSVTSSTPHASNQAATAWTKPPEGRLPNALVCPAETGRTETCGTCGLCWSPAMATTRIIFLGHGKTKRGPSSSASEAVVVPRIAPDNGFLAALHAERERLTAMLRHIDRLIELGQASTIEDLSVAMPKKKVAMPKKVTAPRAMSQTDGRRRENVTPERRAVLVANMAKARAARWAMRHS